MMPPAPSPTPAPIHDITGPFYILPVPVWMIVAACVVLLLLLAALVWLIVHATRQKPPNARQRALAALQTLRARMASETPYAFGIQISDVLRYYISDQYNINAVTRTSIEFLESLRDNAVFDTNEKASLAEFLEASDLLKFARAEAAAAETDSLLEVAERLVRAEKSLKAPAQ